MEFLKLHYKKFVETTFSDQAASKIATLKNKSVNFRDMREFLLSHPRKDLFLGNLQKEMSLLTISGHKLTKDHLMHLLNDLCRLFCVNAIEAKEIALTGRSSVVDKEKVDEYKDKEFELFLKDEGVVEVERDKTINARAGQKLRLMEGD